MAVKASSSVAEDVYKNYRQTVYQLRKDVEADQTAVLSGTDAGFILNRLDHYRTVRQTLADNAGKHGTGKGQVDLIEFAKAYEGDTNYAVVVEYQKLDTALNTLLVDAAAQLTAVPQLITSVSPTTGAVWATFTGAQAAGFRADLAAVQALIE